MNKEKLQEMNKKRIEKKAFEEKVAGILSEITTLSKPYDAKTFEVALGRWKALKSAQRRADKEIAQAEARLQEVKKRYNK